MRKQGKDNFKDEFDLHLKNYVEADLLKNRFLVLIFLLVGI